MNLIDSLIEELFPYLRENDVDNVERYCPCYQCMRTSAPTYFNMNDVVFESYSTDSIKCQNCGHISIRRLASDVVFDDLDPCLVYHSIPMSGNYEEIGQGGFARVKWHCLLIMK